MIKKYDVIVIGAGSAGLGASGMAISLGLKTLVIEKDARNVGGDCLNFGCVPSKAIIHVAKMVHDSKNAERFGIRSSGEVDMQKVLDYIHEKQEVIRHHENPDYLRSGGIDVEIGTAKFIGKNSVQVNELAFEARLIFLCTGSVPRQIEIPGAEHVDVFTNENLFYEMKTLPKNLLVIGGGPIGCEMAQAIKRLGSEVTIVNRGERLLRNERPEISKILQDVFEKEGIMCHQNGTVQSISEQGMAQISFKDGQSGEVPADAILLAVGRVVRTEGMDLKMAGIELDDRGKIAVNEFYQSTNKKVYVLGDAAGKYMFSHGAEKQVRLVWKNILSPFGKKRDRINDLSWVTFTEPQVATFGLSEAEMHRRGIQYWRQDQSFHKDDRAIVDEYEYGYMSIYFNRSADIKQRKIIGATIIAPNAGEMIQELELAAAAEIPIETIYNRVYSYPVGSRMNQTTVKGLYEKSMSKWQRKLAKKIFKALY